MNNVFKQILGCCAAVAIVGVSLVIPGFVSKGVAAYIAISFYREIIKSCNNVLYIGAFL